MTRRLWDSVDEFLEGNYWHGRQNYGDVITQELLENTSLIGQQVYFNKPMEKRVVKLHPYSERNTTWIKNQSWVIRAIRFSDQWRHHVEYLLEHDGGGWATEEGPHNSLELEGRWYSALDGRWLTPEQVEQLTDIYEDTDYKGNPLQRARIVIDDVEHNCYVHEKLNKYLMAWGKELLFPEYVDREWRSPIGRFNARTAEEIAALTKPVPVNGEELLPYAIEAANKLGWNSHDVEEVIYMAEVVINEYKSADSQVVSIESGSAKLNLTVDEAKELLTKIPTAIKQYENTRYNALADQVKLLTEEMLKIKPKVKK